MASRKSTLLAVSALFCGLLLAGCDDYVQITRDPDVRIPKLATWAWRSAPEPNKARERDSRPVVSRDVISRGETVERDTNADNEMVRQRVKTAIEATLASKGLNPQGCRFPGGLSIRGRAAERYRAGGLRRLSRRRVRPVRLLEWLGLGTDAGRI